MKNLNKTMMAFAISAILIAPSAFAANTASTAATNENSPNALITGKSNFVGTNGIGGGDIYGSYNNAIWDDNGHGDLLGADVFGNNNTVGDHGGSVIVGSSDTVKSINPKTGKNTPDSDFGGVIVGTNSDAVNGGVSIGNSVKAGIGSVTEGYKAQSGDMDVVAGYQASAANVKNSIAMGANTIAEQNDVMAVGGRRITQVAAGVADTDAVNVSQLKHNLGLAQSYTDTEIKQSDITTLQNAKNYSNTENQKTLDSANTYAKQQAQQSVIGADNYTNKVSKTTLDSANDYTNTQISKIHTGVNQYIDQTVQTSTSTIENDVKNNTTSIDNLGNKIDSIQASGISTDNKAIVENATGVAANKETGAKNAIGIAANKQTGAKNAIGIAANKQTGANNVKGIAANKQTGANNSKGIAANKQTGANNSKGIVANKQTGTNNANGINKNHQLILNNTTNIKNFVSNNGANTLKQANAYTDKKFNYLNGEIGQVRDLAEAGTASAMAMSAISIVPNKPINIGFGLGGYGSEGAFAVGVKAFQHDSYKTSTVESFSLSYDTTHHIGASAGVTWGF